MPNQFVKYNTNRIISSKALRKLTGEEKDFLDLLMYKMGKETNEVKIDEEMNSGDELGKSRGMIYIYKKSLIECGIIKKVKRKIYMVNPMICNCADSRNDQQALTILYNKWEKLK